ncbi:MAG TPA: glycosyltransferase family 2 protein [Clostridiaceae bacterium]|nr:glycosyltransferase family 2 protein [Clostridiaceae bacterium]
MNILVIVPAYNEERSITEVIKSVKKNIPQSTVLVINDGSKDNTLNAAIHAGAKVIDLPFNLGIGGAMQTGFLYALRNNYDIAVQVDADGQHDPGYITKLIEPVANGLADMCIGSRYICKTSYKSSVLRRVGMIFFSNLIYLLTGNKIKDPTSGYRAVNRKVICYFSKNYPIDYPEVDVLVKLFRKKYKIMEIPVEMKVRNTGKSSITPIRSVYYMIKVSLSLLIGAVRSAEK